jgi:phosphoserine phosphatase
MHEIFLISVNGEDRPGVTHSLSSVLSAYDVTVLDIGQAVIHKMLSLGMLVRVPESAQSAPILKDLLFKAHELGVQIQFEPVEVEDYNAWVQKQGKARHIITLLGERLDAEHIAAVTELLAAHSLNIDIIHRLSGRIPIVDTVKTPYACVEMSVRGIADDADELRERFLELSHETGIDIAFQADDLYRRHRRLVAFDMDSTLIQTEVIDELANAAGVGPEVSAITEAAMRGELDFKESLRQRLALLKGLDVSVMAGIAESLPLTEGAERLLTTLNQLGYKTAIISGGFTYFGDYLQNKLGVDHVFANELEIVDGKLTGNVVGDVVDGEKKADCLRELASRENVCLNQVVAVGDGANDLPMLRLAGLGIAFRAKPLVKQHARHALSAVGLDGILYLIGVRDRETTQLQEPK